jgi:hypothetical protein
VEGVDFGRGLFGGPDRDRTDDLFHAITSIACNLLILGASVATISILEHSKTTLSTFASTFKIRKEEVVTGWHHTADANPDYEKHHTMCRGEGRRH